MATLAEVERLVMSLPAADRLRLLEATWDSLGQELPVPEWHKAELEAGLAEYEANTAEGLPWQDALDHVRSQLGK
jgi:putative addiction module component (TIGR02574 family)